MKNYKFILFFLILFLTMNNIYSEDIEIEVISIDDFIEKVNKENELNQKDFGYIAKNFSYIISNYYVYSYLSYSSSKEDIYNNFRNFYAYSSKTYLNFFNNIMNKLYPIFDTNINIIFKNINKYHYFLPFEYYVKTENDVNNLYLRLTNNSLFQKYFENDINTIKENSGSKIIEIQSTNPFDYIQQFGTQFLKDPNAQFSYNLKNIVTSPINFPFEKKKFNEINIKFDNGKSMTISYKIYIIKNINDKEFKSYYDKIISNYNNSIFTPSIFQIKERYELEKGKSNSSLINWDLNYKNMIKYKKDENKKVNVIYQNDFMLDDDAIDFFGTIMEKMDNDYPIIIIESMNYGGNVDFVPIFEKILNYDTTIPRIKISYRMGKNESNLANYLYKKVLYEPKTCQPTFIFLNETSKIDSFKSIGNNPSNKTNYRTDFFLLYNTHKDINLKLEKYKKSKKRKPTEILIFTDGVSLGATSILLKDIHENGKAIIAGYNGDPSEQNKKIKFDSSQSPSIYIEPTKKLLSDYNVEYLMNYNISSRVSFAATYNDNFQNESNFINPREYINNSIDERSKIYGYYTDERYDEFINEGLRIIKKYETECNSDNNNLLLYNDKCKKDSNIFGGFKCDVLTNKWSDQCEFNYCEDGYYFDNFQKKCIKDYCRYSYILNKTIMIGLFCVFIVSFVFLIYIFLIKGVINSDDIGGSLIE